MLKQGKGLSVGSGLRADKSLGGSNTLKANNSAPLKAKKHINGKSKKQAARDKELTKVYKVMDSREDRWCSGCGDPFALDHSHIIPRSYREDLITDPENITDHCTTCHDLWEHGTLEEMKSLEDFEKNMAYIKKVDLKYYHLIMNKK